jgi:hypothetical protein
MLNYVRRKGITFGDRVESSKRGFQARRGRKTVTAANFNAKILSRRRRQIEAAVRKEIKGVNSAELRAQKAAAFLIGRSIGRRGVRALLLFSRVLFVKRGAINHTKANIEREIGALLRAS